MKFADIHNHTLAAVDDGAKSEQMMYRMLDAAYADGTRILCLTPHFHPGFFGDNRNASEDSFQKLQSYAAQHCPHMQLYLGNELRYSPNCDHWLREGLCRTLNGTAFILVDFAADALSLQIRRGLEQLLSMGYVPVLAHAERYSRLSVAAIRDFHRNGIRIQINAGSLTGSFGWRARLRAKRLLSEHLVCTVASDGHNLKERPPLLSESYLVAKKLTDPRYADRIFFHNAKNLLENN
jgi:protein-tyrosine phosphatase